MARDYGTASTFVAAKMDRAQIRLVYEAALVEFASATTPSTPVSADRVVFVAFVQISEFVDHVPEVWPHCGLFVVCWAMRNEHHCWADRICAAAKVPTGAM